MIWMLQIIYFSFSQMNWKIEGGKKKRASMEEFKWAPGGGTKLEAALDLVTHKMFSSAKSKA